MMTSRTQTKKKKLSSTDKKTIKKALSILKRTLRTSGEDVFTSPDAAKQYLQLQLAAHEREVFAVLFLNNKNQLISFEVLFQGTVNKACVYVREVIKAALEYNAAAFVLAHNHPSGNPDPSKEDDKLTLRTKQACELMDIRLLDHIIVTPVEIYSFAENQRGEL